MRVTVVGLAIFLLGVARHAEVLAQSAPTVPSLVADGAPTSTGASSRRFTIASHILGETRRIGIELPASYARSATGMSVVALIALYSGMLIVAPECAITGGMSVSGTT